MKSLILVFVSLFFVNAQAADTPIPAVPSADAQAMINAQNEREDRREREQKLKDAKTACSDAKKDKLEKEDKLNEKITELEEKKVDEKRDLLEKINEKDAEISLADVEFKKALDLIQEEINVNEEEKDAKLRALNDLISKQVQALKKIMITDRNKVERDYQQNLTAAYSQCNIIAQKDLKDRKLADRAEKQAQNAGQIKTGGAGFNGNTNKKIKAEVAKGYKECLAMAEEALKSKRTNAIEELKDLETAAQTEITNTTQELNDYVTKKYPKKAIELNEKLNTVAQENTQKKNSLSQQKQALQQALNEKMSFLDKQIQSRNAELLNKSAPGTLAAKAKVRKEIIEDMRLDACCTESNGVYTAIDGTGASAICRQYSKPKKVTPVTPTPATTVQ